jgi:serine/threonine protein kinase
LHDLGLVHGDIKPANLLVTMGMQLKLTDFDTCRAMTPKSKLLGVVGTPLFLAPEAFNETGYTEKIDVYAFAVTGWVICTQKLPYEDVPLLRIVEEVIGGARPSPLLPAGHPLKKIIEDSWHPKPQKRPTFNEIYNALQGLVTPSVSVRLSRQNSSAHLKAKLLNLFKQ